MKHLPNLDFALNRAQRQRQRHGVIAALALLAGLQVGLGVWRWQSLQSQHADLLAQQRQWASKAARATGASLTPEQLKLAMSAQNMLDGLAVPWDVLLQAIEAARPAQVVVDAIQPHAQDGVVSVSVSSPNFAGVAAFVQALIKQPALRDVMLASEALPDTGGAGLRAVIQAKWTASP